MEISVIHFSKNEDYSLGRSKKRGDVLPKYNTNISFGSVIRSNNEASDTKRQEDTHRVDSGVARVGRGRKRGKRSGWPPPPPRNMRARETESSMRAYVRACAHSKHRATVFSYRFGVARSRMTERGCGPAWPALVAELYMNGA